MFYDTSTSLYIYILLFCFVINAYTYIHFEQIFKQYGNETGLFRENYRQTSNIIHTWVGNNIVDYSDVVGASPIGATPTTSSFSTEHLASMDWEKGNCKAIRQLFKFWDLFWHILGILRYVNSTATDVLTEFDFWNLDFFIISQHWYGTGRWNS